MEELIILICLLLVGLTFYINLRITVNYMSQHPEKYSTFKKIARRNKIISYIICVAIFIAGRAIIVSIK
jgi:t-SNARE complex subunit (syntaxin)